VITNEQMIAVFDQDAAVVRDRLNSLVETYRTNMDHVAECDQCSELHNIMELIRWLNDEARTNDSLLTILLAVAIKMLCDERTGAVWTEDRA
jgi:hypothetical protein